MRFLWLSFKNIASLYKRRKDKVAKVFGECESQTVGVRGHSKGVNSAHKHFNINISFALTFLSAFFLMEAACPVIPMFLLQAATNEAHLLSRENKAKPHSQSSICCYIGGL